MWSSGVWSISRKIIGFTWRSGWIWRHSTCWLLCLTYWMIPVPVISKDLPSWLKKSPCIEIRKASTR
ncbi:hypothetical protein BDV23DRAFT_146109 [Aspergillus alliaceus]|uniref:Uncharacterized protein n=1 Tax=Petromyces alliaceus TaxID=209559 RepID=A0A5N7CMN8_PETAA|nr:hypothetical protein BDV23DRAFT_146109 [Aspergillus alliaceus]